MGVKETDTGLAAPNLWDVPADEGRMREEQPLQVARCTKIIKASDKNEGQDGANGDAQGAGGQGQGGEGGSQPSGAGGLAGSLGGLGALGGMGASPPTAEEEDKYVINIKQIAKFVVGLGERVAPTDIEEGMRVGYVTVFAYS